jgi:purine nucleoside permease
MEEIVKIYTSGKADYFMTASEDNAVIEALLRAALQSRVDYSRIILCQAGSNFDRSHSNTEKPSLSYLMDHGGVGPANRNLYLSGLKIVQGIIEEWSTKFEQGIKADNYISDVHGALGETPDFGPAN